LNVLIDVDGIEIRNIPEIKFLFINKTTNEKEDLNLYNNLCMAHAKQK